MQQLEKHKQGSVAELMVIALPMVISNTCEVTMIFIDRLFLSKLGPEQMNAAMGGGLTCFMMMTFFLGLIGFSTALVAQYLGSGKQNKCAAVTTQAIIICCFAYPIILMTGPIGPWLFEFSGIDPQQIGPQIIYRQKQIFF